MKSLVCLLLLCGALSAQLNTGPNYIGDPAQFVIPPFPTWIMSQQPLNTVPFPTMERPPASIFTFPIMSWFGSNSLGDILQFNFHWAPTDVAAVGLPTANPAVSPGDIHPNKGTTFLFVFFDAVGQGAMDLPLNVGGTIFNLGPAFAGQPPMLEYVIPPMTTTGLPYWASLTWPPITTGPDFGEVAHNELIQGFPSGSAASTAGLQLTLNVFALVPNDLGQWGAFFTTPVTVTL
ncbi:MAG TPA: hypothetical protein ENK43_04350 [Planctomycetes bacterium]|nr:hypothetical protein [Planctomycetota bacterium]